MNKIKCLKKLQSKFKSLQSKKKVYSQIEKKYIKTRSLLPTLIFWSTS